MLEIVREWVRNLAFLVLFTTVAEMLLPAGEMRKFVRFVLGLVFILAIVNPLGDALTRGRFSLDILPHMLATPPAPARGWEETADAVTARGAEAVAGQYAEGVAAQMRAFLSLVPGMEPVAVEPRFDASGRLVRVEVRARTTAAGEAQRDEAWTKARRLLSDLYALEASRIEIRWEEE
ncbi:MAG TPA: stage III sporulation protein AF [Limnochordia bacterium]